MMKGSKSLHHIIDSEQIAGHKVDKIRSIGIDLGTAIQHLHGEGSIHGDMKSKNIVRASDGDIKLIDFDASVRIGQQIYLLFTE